MPLPSQMSSFLDSQKENMDQFNHQNIQTQRQFSNSHHLRIAIQFILTVSVMSFFFSYSSQIPFLLHSFNVYFSTFYMQLNSYTIDRKLYMFLLCNGILVLIVKNSGLIRNYPLGTDHYDKHIKNHRDSQQLLLEVLKAKASVVMEIEEEDGRYNGFLIAEDEDKEEGNGFLVNKEEEKEEEEEEEGGIGMLSTEELNKKCDEFIKMMKEGIKNEAQQLIMV